MLVKLTRVVSLLFALTFLSCDSGRRTTYDVAYSVQGNSFKLLDTDALIYEANAILLETEGEPQPIEGELLAMHFAVTNLDDDYNVSSIRYRRLNSKNEQVAEITAFDKDNDGHFDSVSVNGDISLISAEWSQGLNLINQLVREDIERIQRDGKKTIIDIASGEEVEEGSE